MNTSAWAKVKQVFEQKYAAWNLIFPIEPLQVAAHSTINNQGWTINFRYVLEGAEYCLEYFASHRMTNDTLNQIYADGREEVIGYCQEFYLADDPQAEQGYFEHNRKFYEDVRQRGLL